MFEALKDYFFKLKLSKMLNRKRKVQAFDQIKSCCIILDAKDAQALNSSQAFIKKHNKTIEIKLFLISESSTASHNPATIQLGPKSCNWLDIPKAEHLEGIMDQHFDLLILTNSDYSRTADYLFHEIKAELKLTTSEAFRQKADIMLECNSDWQGEIPHLLNVLSGAQKIKAAALAPALT